MEKNKLILAVIMPLIISFLIISTVFVAIGYYGTLPIFILPIIPIVYGQITRDRTGSILVGIGPIIAGLIIDGLLISGQLYNIRYIFYLIPYYGGLSVVGGLEGYFASKGDLKVAIGFGILWIMIFLSRIS